MANYSKLNDLRMVQSDLIFGHAVNSLTDKVASRSIRDGVKLTNFCKYQLFIRRKLWPYVQYSALRLRIFLLFIRNSIKWNFYTLYCSLTLISEEEEAGGGQSRLFVGGLPQGVSTEQVRGLFKQYGDVKDVYIPAG